MRLYGFLRSACFHPDLERQRRHLGVVLRNDMLLAIAGCTATSNLFASMIGAVMVLYAVERLGMSPFLIGAMFALGSVGSLIAAVIATRLAAHVRFGGRIVLSATGFS